MASEKKAHPEGGRKESQMQFVYGLIGIILIIAILWNSAPWLLILIGAGLIVLVIVFIVKRANNGAPKYDLSQYTVDYTINTKVAGVTFNGIQNVLPTLHSGMTISFIREPNNRYDKNAVAVICKGNNIGHLSAELASDIAPIMDNGIPVTGKILNISGGGRLSYGCNIEVTVYKPIREN